LKTALHLAALKNNNDIVFTLINHGANIEARDDLGCTALHLACKKGCEQAVDELLINGAYIYAKDERDWTPLHYAAYNGFPKICKNLLTFSVDDEPKLRDSKNS
jgi:ankyrin repeat protein